MKKLLHLLTFYKAMSCDESMESLIELFSHHVYCVLCFEDSS